MVLLINPVLDVYIRRHFREDIISEIFGIKIACAALLKLHEDELMLLSNIQAPIKAIQYIKLYIPSKLKFYSLFLYSEKKFAQNRGGIFNILLMRKTKSPSILLVRRYVAISTRYGTFSLSNPSGNTPNITQKPLKT